MPENVVSLGYQLTGGQGDVVLQGTAHPHRDKPHKQRPLHGTEVLQGTDGTGHLNRLNHNRFLRAGVLQGTLPPPRAIFPIARMRFLPLAHSLGVLGVPKIIFVAWLLQPGLLTRSFARPLTIRFGTETLPLTTSIIGKKMFLAVQAVASLHRSPNPANQDHENQGKNRKKIQREENPENRRKKKKSPRTFRRKTNRRRPISLPFALSYSHLGLGTRGTFPGACLGNV
jgi:hypothetical protein